jgi:hypothetical protein
MAPPPPLTILDPYAWERSSVTPLALNELVTAGQLAANEEGRPAEWIVPPARDRGHGAEASSSRAGHSAQVGGAAGDPPAFPDARGEQELWGELRSHGATLNRALNEALRVHGGPAWHVFQVGRCCSFSSFSRFCALFLCHGAYGF